MQPSLENIPDVGVAKNLDTTENLNQAPFCSAHSDSNTVSAEEPESISQSVNAEPFGSDDSIKDVDYLPSDQSDDGGLDKTNQIQKDTSVEPWNNSCRIKCKTRISQEERINIFTSFWNLANVNRQRDFLNNLVEVIDCKRRTTGTNNLRRSKSMKFYLCIKDSRINICRTILLNTLGVKKGFLNFAIKKRVPNSNTTEKDKRGALKYQKMQYIF
ncbi:uncharacterized protein LOC126749797 [Anthonomus grandis grandis]|uniref:uncharacterized protein LOC126749797 n=1 Tax=Anthonomus grandis grandis TaxID=2921223 RepID=UPI0021656699|nr:uncharacterized protein LOC126749797 [Anthonomus grandis grandis]